MIIIGAIISFVFLFYKTWTRVTLFKFNTTNNIDQNETADGDYISERS